MRNAFIFHGTDGYPQQNWFPWLKKELQPMGFNVHVPQFPTEVQTLRGWFDILKDYKNFIDEETLMVGHSLGGAFLLRVLENTRKKIAVACTVSAPVGVPPINYSPGDHDFFGEPFDWETIKNNARKFVVFHSNNDRYVPLGNADQIAEQVGTTLNFIPNAGHFDELAGYFQFEELRNRIKEIFDSEQQ